MTFEWPLMLWLLLLIPALTLAWLRLSRARSVLAARYAGLRLTVPGDALEATVSGVATDGPAGNAESAWSRRRRHLREHLPAVLLLAALTLAIIGVARPRAAIVLPSQQQTILLAIDVSLSMRARDVEPNRMTAAKVAAKAFIEALPRNVKAGIVAFAGTASLVQPPTLNRDELLAAIDRLEMQRGTATGSALVVSLATLFPDAGIDIESMLFDGSRRSPPRAASAPREGTKQSQPFTPVAPGSYASAAIILLSDGRRTTGVDPTVAARMAADRGVRVYTVGIGTPAGGEVDFGGMSVYMRLDEEALKMMADLTQGEYRFAGTAEDLRKVYEGLSTRITLETQRTEITFLLAGLAAALALLSAGCSLWWRQRIL